MADDIKTKLVVEGGFEFIKTLTAGAVAQDRLTTAISTASGLHPTDLSKGISQVVDALIKGDKAANQFKVDLLAAFPNNPEEIERVTSSIARNTKALRENIQALKDRKAQEARTATLAEQFRATSPTGFQTGLRQTNTGFEAGRFNTGNVNNLQASVGNQAFAQQQAAFLQQQESIRNAIESRAIEADKLRAAQRAKIAEENAQQLERINARTLLVRTAQVKAEELLANQEAKVVEDAFRRKKVAAIAATAEAEKQKTIEANFAKQNPLIANGPLNVAGAGASTQTATAIKSVDEAQTKATRSGVTYLSSLSAIHSASFLLTGTTFSTAQSLSTLGLAAGQVGATAGQLNLKMALLGTGVGVVFLGIHTVTQAVTQVIQNLISVAETGATALLKFGAAGVTAFGAVSAASIKLASASEDVFAEIAAFGQPTRDQFIKLEEQVSQTARTFGTSAKDVGTGVSLFVRAGGEVAGALNGGTEAITKLQIASRGELIPATAARSIVTITNLFEPFKNNAEGAADLITGLAQKSALSFNEVSQAIQQAGPTAALANIPLLDLATTIALLANNGLKGQVAGTGFKQFLLDLIHPTGESVAELQRLNISFQDTEHNVRPLKDIFGDLQRALGSEAKAFNETGDAAKLQSLAIIFGARANLAAGIIANSTAEDFDKLQAAIGATKVADVVDILLSTTSAQAAIAKTNIEELGRAFGGPLNVGIGTALKSVNEFLKGIDRNKFAVAGQAILAVITGGGFEKVQSALGETGNVKVIEFFSNLLKAATTVRNVLVNDFAPSVASAFKTVSDAAGQIDLKNTFTGIANGIITVITVGKGLITFTSDLIRDFITGNDRGKDIKETLAGLATVVGTALVGSFIALAIPTALTIKILEAVGDATINLLDDMNKFNTIWDAGWQLAKDSVNNFARDVAPGLQALGEILVGNATNNTALLQRGIKDFNAEGFKQQATTIITQTGDIDKAILQTSAQIGTLKADITRLTDIKQNQSPLDKLLGVKDFSIDVDDLQKQLTNLEGTLDSLQAIKQGNLGGALLDSNVLNGITEAKRQIDTLRNLPKIDLDKLISEGNLPESLTNLAAQLKEIQDTFNRGAPDQGTDSGVFPDPKKEATIAREVRAIVSSEQQDILDILADSAIKEEELRAGTTEKLTALDKAYTRSVNTLIEQRDQRIRESDETFKQSRDDRNTLQAIQRTFELESFLREQDHSRRDLLISQEDAADDRRNQRRVQDADTTLSQIESREQRSQEIKDAIRDRAFQRSQAADSTQFSRAQSREEVAFERTLAAQATARTNAQRLADAKTPQDRATVLKDINQQGLDLKFTQQQEEQRSRFRIQQEDKRIKFAQQQEDTAFQHTIANEQAAFDFRVGLELKYLAIRRAGEDTETARTNQLAAFRLARQLGFSTQDFEFRIDQSNRLQSKQDEVANAQHELSNQHIRDEADTRRKELGTKLADDIFAIFDDSDRQRENNQDAQQKRLRELIQRSQRGLTAINEREGPQAGVNAALDRTKEDLVITDLLIQKNTLDAKLLAAALRDTSLTQRGLPLERSDTQASFPNITGPAIRIDPAPLLPLLSQLIGQINQSQKPSQNSITVQGNVLGNDEFLKELQQSLVRLR